MFQFSRNSISIAGFSIRYYGILIALGALLGVLLAMKREKRLGLAKDTALDTALICIPIAVVCSRLYYVAFEWDSYKNDLLRIFDVRGGGLAIYGGVLGGMLAGVICAKWKKIRYVRLADLVAPSVALGQAVGRWGNFLNQEAYGVAVTDPRWQFFPVSVFIQRDGLWHCATFFYESVWCFGIVAFLLIAERKRFFRKSGDIFWWYALLYALERAAVEGLRTDSLYWGAFRVSQALALTVACAVAALFALRAKRHIALRIAGVALPLAALILVSFGIVPSVSPAALLLSAATLALGAYNYTANPRADGETA